MPKLLPRSYRGRIDLVVLPMCANELHQHAAIPISDVNHQAKLVAADIEDHAAISNEINIVSEHLLHIRRSGPLGGCDHAVPRAQRLLRRRMPFPELPQRPARDDLHRRIIWHIPSPVTAGLFPIREYTPCLVDCQLAARFKLAPSARLSPRPFRVKSVLCQRPCPLSAIWRSSMASPIRSRR